MDIVLLNEKAVVPEYSTDGSGAFDLRACITKPIAIAPNATARIGTGIAIHIKDKSLAGLIMPRSGLGVKGLNLANTVGFIDSDYQGEIMIVVRNTSKDFIEIKPMDRIAQMAIVPIKQVSFNVVKQFSNATERGTGGFNSTGVK